MYIYFLFFKLINLLKFTPLIFLFLPLTQTKLSRAGFPNLNFGPQDQTTCHFGKCFLCRSLFKETNIFLIC